MTHKMEVFARAMGLTIKSLFMSLLVMLVLPPSYNVLALTVGWFFYLGSMEYWVNLLPLPLCEALIHMRLFVEMEASSRAIALILIACYISPVLRFTSVVGAVSWIGYTVYVFSNRFIGIETSDEEINFNHILIDTFKQFNVLIYRLTAQKSKQQFDEPIIRQVLGRLNKSLTKANAKISDRSDRYHQSVAQLTQKITDLERSIATNRIELEGCCKSKTGLKDVIEKVHEDVVFNEECFHDIHSELETCRRNLRSKKSLQTYWKIVSFMFFPLVIGYLINQAGCRRLESLIANYNKQLLLHGESVEQSTSQKEALVRKKGAAEDWERHLTKQLKTFSNQLAQKQRQRESILAGGERIKGISSFLLQLQSKVVVMCRNVDTAGSCVEDIVNFLDPHVRNGSLTHLTTPSMIDNFRRYYLRHD